MKRKSSNNQQSASEKKKPGTKRKYVRRKALDPVSPEKTVREVFSVSRDSAAYCDPSSLWVIVELNEDTILELHHDQIARAISETLGPGTEFFIPIYNEDVQGKKASFVHFEGYVFIKRTDEIVKNILKLKDEYIRGALIVDGSLRLVSGVRINKFKKEMYDRITSLIPEKGQRVVPKVGVFKNLEGRVLSVDKKKLVAVVRFEKPSRVVDAPINIVNLTIIPE